MTTSELPNSAARDPGDEALFRAAEYDRDLILSREAETACGKRGERAHQERWCAVPRAMVGAGS
jgi:hypothetical protein